MQFLEEGILAIADSTWQSMLVDIHPRALPASMGPDEGYFTRKAEIAGALTNVIGGNIRSLFPGPCQHSVPIVVARTDSPFRILGMKRMSEPVFPCRDQPVFFSDWHRQ